MWIDEETDEPMGDCADDFDSVTCRGCGQYGECAL